MIAHKILALISTTSVAFGAVLKPSQSQHTSFSISQATSPRFTVAQLPNGQFHIEGTATTIDFDALSQGFHGNVTALRIAVDEFFASKYNTASLQSNESTVNYLERRNCRVDQVEWTDGPHYQYFEDYPCMKCDGTDTLAYSYNSCFGATISGQWDVGVVKFGVQASASTCTGWTAGCTKTPSKQFICMRGTVSKEKQFGWARYTYDCGEWGGSREAVDSSNETNAISKRWEPSWDGPTYIELITPKRAW
ncbi:hypothetical protein HDV05_007994 [Chytridiales sp. JEL 0842]|nr:hypothetical protein HDV05_007994 [Chytridiales sp. JEL 0842]